MFLGQTGVECTQAIPTIRNELLIATHTQSRTYNDIMYIYINYTVCIYIYIYLSLSLTYTYMIYVYIYK